VAIQPLGMVTVAGKYYRVTYDITFKINSVVSGANIFHLYNWNIAANPLTSSGTVTAGQTLTVHVDKYFVANTSQLAAANWLVDTRYCSGTATISNYTITEMEKIVDIASTSYTALSADTDILNDLSPFVYGSQYVITFDYSVVVSTVSVSTNMVFALKNYSAFTYLAIKTLSPTTTTTGTYTGSVVYAATASKNAGTLMKIMFRPYSGLANVTVTNLKIYKYS
jgi:hypothetical protein